VLGRADARASEHLLRVDFGHLRCVSLASEPGTDPAFAGSAQAKPYAGASAAETDYKEAVVVLLWVLVALLLLFAVVGGVAISKFLFFVLIVAVLLALIGFFTRTA
jgi:hypothetical protein